MRTNRSTTHIAGAVVALVVAAVLCAGALTRPAAATHISDSAQYFNGWLGPQQGASTPHAGFCQALWASTASWDAVGWRVKVVLIDLDGSWVSAEQSTDGTVETYVNPDFYSDLKAHCKNNEDIYSFAVRCFRSIAGQHGCA